VKSYKDLLLVSGLHAEPKELKLNDNIAVVFYVHLVLLLVSLAAYAVEILSLYCHNFVIEALLIATLKHN